MVGIETTWKSRAVSGLASTSSLATVRSADRSAAISSSTGATILQGPHHVAQKSTSTGLLLDNTSVGKEASETSIVADLSESLIAVLQTECRDCPRLRSLRVRLATVRHRWRRRTRCRRR